MTALAMGVRELHDGEVEAVSGGFWPIVAIAVAATNGMIAAHNYMLQRGAADHDANCTEH